MKTRKNLAEALETIGAPHKVTTLTDDELSGVAGGVSCDVDIGGGITVSHGGYPPHA